MAAQRKNSPMDHPVAITLLIFAVIAFMYEAAEVLKPLALAILLSFALVPISRQLERLKIPRVAAVVLTVLIVLGSLGCRLLWGRPAARQPGRQAPGV